MVISKGIEMKGVCRSIVRILKIIEVIFRDVDQTLVIIGSNWGHDGMRFAHESGNAIDICPPAKKRYLVLTRIRLCLGWNYIVLDERSHLHIEFCPMPLLRKQRGNT